MNKFLTSILIAITSFSAVNAQSTSTAQLPALDINLEWGPFFETGTAETRSTYSDVLDTAIELIKAIQPKGDYLFNWKGDRTVLANKTFEIYYTFSDDKYLSAKIAQTGATMAEQADSMTLMMKDKGKEKGSLIMLCLFADKIFFDKNGVERKDGLARLTVALAYEVYSNVQMYLNYDLSPTSTKKLPTRKQSEISAFITSVNFINTVISSLESGPLSFIIKEPERTKLIGDFNTALISEKLNLEYWKNVPDDTK
jgi:hypothetical protein